MSIADHYNKLKYLQYKIYFIVAPNSGIQNTGNIKYLLILKLSLNTRRIFTQLYTRADIFVINYALGFKQGLTLKLYNIVFCHQSKCCAWSLDGESVLEHIVASYDSNLDLLHVYQQMVLHLSTSQHPQSLKQVHTPLHCIVSCLLLHFLYLFL